MGVAQLYFRGLQVCRRLLHFRLRGQLIVVKLLQLGGRQRAGLLDEVPATTVGARRHELSFGLRFRCPLGVRIRGQQLVGQTNQLLAFLHVIADVDMDCRHTIAAHLRTDHRLLPRIDASRSHQRAHQCARRRSRHAHRHGVLRARCRRLGCRWNTNQRADHRHCRQ